MTTQAERNPSPSEEATLSADRDIEAWPSSAEEHKKPPVDPYLVTWDGPQDPENPKNWPNSIKWRYTVAVSLFTFISPVSSSMVAPALKTLGEDLHMHSEIEMELSLSIFILGYAVGPVFFGPASELHGRVLLLQISNLWYLAWNLGCGFAQTPAELFVFRFLAGIGGSAPLALGGGALSDTWSAEERGKAMGIYTLAPIIGPVVGPIAGGFIAEYTTWRWVFWATSVAAVFIQLVGLMWLRESHPGTLLMRKQSRLVKETGDSKFHTGAKVESLPKKLRGALVRPLRMLTTQPIVTVIALYMAYLFGTIYLITATFPSMWAEKYGESTGIGGLNYISIAVGSLVGVFLNFNLIDRIYRQLKEQNDGIGRPEFRTPTMFMGSILVIVGLFWYGWSVQGHVHWIMPNIGVAIFAAGAMGCLQGMQTYVVDSYQIYAASAMAACAILRSLAGFGFPLFAPYLYQSLGYGWGTSVLAFISVGLGLPAPFLFWKFGPKLRAMSKFASG
ncbi:synaptic vesicle transporter [Aspergillus sclerotiicarbonarius CBS 121057]|uniref:Synaptic vesicle transporter n=1 Tax=Aspergillus sclerotiicarbonarius (strain CBS 121057 / IBT 28362) TaxID=1448318 RepID=A0A319EJI8_ASPSB|nr:synaptic vesicle transporter [Aspergillus sclerotiicarbonarius CBS 121057]